MLFYVFFFFLLLLLLLFSFLHFKSLLQENRNRYWEMVFTDWLELLACYIEYSFHDGFSFSFHDINEKVIFWLLHGSGKLARQIFMKFFFRIPWTYLLVRKESYWDILKTLVYRIFWKMCPTSFHDIFLQKHRRKNSTDLKFGAHIVLP